MAEMIPLSEWIHNVREQIAEAQFRLVNNTHLGGAPSFSLGLEEITLETALVTERAEDGKLGFKVFVVSGEMGDAQKESTTQKIAFRLRPAAVDGTQIMLGDPNERDCFQDSYSRGTN